MRKTIGLPAVALAAALAAGSARAEPVAAAPACAMTAGDAAWLDRALAAWRSTARRGLALPDAPLPDLVVFDAACAWRAEARSDGAAPKLAAEPHGATVALPGGGEVPARVTSFAAPWDQDRRAFLVMALPGVWRAAGKDSELGLETLTTAVFVHEATHTRQFYAFTPRMAELGKKWNLPDDLDDDAVQTRFGETAEYVQAYEAERDLLFRAAAAADAGEAKRLAREALAGMQARRARWFTGDDARYADLEDAFLTLEGVGNFAALSWLADPAGGGIAPERALASFRRGGRFWSQDEGLAIFLVVDRLVPGWQARAFAPQPATALELLAEAAK
jgi:hypothetical protein